MDADFRKRHGYTLRLALLAFGGALLAWLLSHPLLGGPGMTWDEAYYYPTFEAASNWVSLLLDSPGAALSSEGIRAGWAPINELPPVVKWLGALFSSFSAEGWNKLAMVRLFPALAFGTNLLCINLLTRRLTGQESWGWLAVLLYALHPKVIGHSAFAATETVFTTMTLLVLLSATGSRRRLYTRIFLLLAVALALATKVNGIILLVTILWWLATRRLFDRRLQRREGAAGWGQDAITAVLIIILSPLLAWAIWPWMWDATGDRLYAYYLFIREHSHQGVWYFGQRWNFNGPPVPVSYPFMITHLTTPLVLLALAWIAIVAGVIRLLWRKGLPANAYLVALAAVAPLVASSLPSAPKYDGVRLFFPMFAPMAVLTALGLHWTAQLLRKKWKKPIAFQSRAPLFLGALAILLAFPLQRPSIDYYNSAARLYASGESVFPFEQTYWGNALTPAALEELQNLPPEKARFKTRAFQGLVFDLYREWGLLKETVIIDGEPPYDYHLIHNRRGFWGNADWTIFANREALGGWGRGYHGEPLIYLYDGRPPGAGI